MSINGQDTATFVDCRDGKNQPELIDSDVNASIVVLAFNEEVIELMLQIHVLFWTQQLVCLRCNYCCLLVIKKYLSIASKYL